MHTIPQFFVTSKSDHGPLKHAPDQRESLAWKGGVDDKEKASGPSGQGPRVL